MISFSFKSVTVMALIIGSAAFLAGRLTAVQPASSETKVSEVKSTTEVDKKTHTQTTTVTTKSPTGEVKTVTTTDTTASLDISKKKDTKEVDTAINYKTKITNVSALVLADIHNIRSAPSFGISVTREVAGPLTVGVLATTNGTLGLSIGVNF